MVDKNVVLGIDTSNYTTSVAIIDTDGNLIANLKLPLTVKAGERGLRQSDALFAHTVNIPKIMNETREYLRGYRMCAIGVSDKPRNMEGSYMPCFLAGVAAAESISTALDVPIFRFSHQCGHVMAAIYSSGREELLTRPFSALHVSGGTTELLAVHPCENGFLTDIVGGTRDLNAGQLIDRVGVHMGLPFPSGTYIERLASEFSGRIPRKKISSAGTEFNLSGLENQAIRLFEESGDKSLVSAFVLDSVGRAIASMCEFYESINGKTTFVFAGGVMSNSIIKRMLADKFDAVFAESAMSADNAVGTAYLALRSYISGENYGY